MGKHSTSTGRLGQTLLSSCRRKSDETHIKFLEQPGEEWIRVTVSDPVSKRKVTLQMTPLLAKNLGSALLVRGTSHEFV